MFIKYEEKTDLTQLSTKDYCQGSGKDYLEHVDEILQILNWHFNPSKSSYVAS